LVSFDQLSLEHTVMLLQQSNLLEKVGVLILQLFQPSVTLLKVRCSNGRDVGVTIRLRNTRLSLQVLIVLLSGLLFMFLLLVLQLLAKLHD
jgi:hypothetical protein